VAFAIIPIVGYGIIISLGANPFDQIQFHAHHVSSGNIPYLLGALGITLTDPGERQIANIVGLIVLSTVFLVAIRSFGLPKGHQAVTLCAIVLITTLLTNKKGFPSYLVIVLFPVCLTVAKANMRWPIWTFVLIVSGLATLDTSLWFNWLGQREIDVIRSPELPFDVTRAHLLIFFVCDLSLVFGYIGLLAVLWCAMNFNSSQVDDQKAITDREAAATGSASAAANQT
jgi:hypothetical protein